MDTKKATRLDEIFISDYDFIGDWITIAVPSNLPNEYRQKIVAALTTAHLGNKSIDRTYKRIKPDLDKIFPTDKFPSENLTEENKLAREIFAFLHDEYRMMYSVFGNIDSTELPLGKHICYLALTRLRVSYRACLMLIRMGFYFESYSIIRMIFEQLCWTLANYTLTDDDDLDKLIQPTKSIAYAKTKFKYIGTFYNNLSHFAHISNNALGNYISQGEDGFILTYSKAEYVYETQIALYSLIKMQINIIEFLYNDEIKNYRYYGLDEGKDIRLIGERFLKFEDRLKKYELKIRFNNK